MFKSWSGFKRALEAPQEGIKDVAGQGRWSNIDLDPTPPEQRKWTKWTYLSFWTSFAASSGSWTTASAVVALGLAPIPAFFALLGAHILLTAFIVMNGRGPARYHIGFPVFARASFGLYGSYYAIVMRAIWCIFFCGTTSYYGSKFVSIAIACIWPKWEKLHNNLPSDLGISSTGMASFFIYFAVMVPISFIHSRDLKWWYIIKSYLCFSCMIFMISIFMVKAHPLDFGIWPAKTMKTSAKAWLVIQAFNTGIGSASSITVNQGDMARYARNPGDQMWSTLIGYPLSAAVPNILGITVATATRKLTGTAMWNMWDQLDYLLSLYPATSAANKGIRFCCFITAVAMAMSYMGVNIATNCLPFGSDLSALFPKYMTIRRGQVLCCAFGIIVQPWKLITGAKSFITFTSAYGYWLAPMAATMAVHYFIVVKGNIDVLELYKPGGRYWYWKGVNVRVIVICVCSLGPCMPGFAYQVNPKLKIDYLGQKFYYIGFLFTYAMVAFLLFVSYKIWPQERILMSKKFEEQADIDDANELAGIQQVLAEDGQSSLEEKEVGASDVRPVPAEVMKV